MYIDTKSDISCITELGYLTVSELTNTLFLLTLKYKDRYSVELLRSYLASHPIA